MDRHVAYAPRDDGGWEFETSGEPNVIIGFSISNWLRDRL